MTDASTTGAVERFEPCMVMPGIAGTAICANGNLVRYDDYSAAIQRAEAAEAQAALAWEAAAQAAYQWWDDDDAQELRQHVRDAAPADLSAALTARLDAEWNAAIEVAADFACHWHKDEQPDLRDDIRALRRAAPTEGEAQSLDNTTRAVLDRAERIVAGQSQQEQRTAEIFLRPTEGEA